MAEIHTNRNEVSAMALNILNATVAGHLVGDPELRFAPNGDAVCQFVVAVNSRRQVDGVWTDEDPSFVPCVVWRAMATNVAESLTKGARVIVSGRMKQSHWQDKNTNEKRSRWSLTVSEIGASLAFATVKIQKMARTNETSPDDPWHSFSKERPTTGDDNDETGDEIFVSMPGSTDDVNGDVDPAIASAGKGSGKS